MGRSYWGLINGDIPRFIRDELPFSDMCCNFTGYMLRFKECGCCLYEYEELDGSPKLYTECRLGKSHKEITQDTSFARWSCNRSDINNIHEIRREIEQLIPIKNYVYLDEDHEIKYRNEDDLDNLSLESNYQIFRWVVLTELLVAFDRYMTNECVVFTSECV
jgi:hypothetical protein